MEFKISRTSYWGENKPCEEAFKKKYYFKDIREFSPDNVPIHVSKRWYLDGENHRVENNRIVRDILKEDWFIKIDTLEDLLNFFDKYGSLVINKYYGQSVIELEIYDDYRE